MKFLIANEQTDTTGQRILIANVDLGVKPYFLLLTAEGKPIGRCKVTREGSELLAEVESLPDAFFSGFPAISLSVRAHDVEETASGRIDILRCSLKAVIIAPVPGKNPTIRSIKEQMETGNHTKN